MKRPFAPGADRLRSLIARQKQMPAALAEARKNLANPPRIYTEIAIEQIDGNIAFFKADLPAAFKEVTDPSLQAEFASTNAAVVAALEDYKTFLEKELLPKLNGTFAWGADTYGKALAANEMIELSLDRLLAIAEQDLQKNEAAFQATAREIDASKPPDAVLVSLQRDHPRADKLLETTQNELDELRRFIVERRIVTVPTSEPASVKETPPFMRSTTSASMDTPGPFEKAQLQGFYHMTLPTHAGSQRDRRTSCARGTTRRSRLCRSTRCIPVTISNSCTPGSSRPTCARCSAPPATAKGGPTTPSR